MNGESAEAVLQSRSRPAHRLASNRTAIAIGGAAGAYLRVIVDEVIGPPGDGWPWATFAVNMLGAFLLGYFTARLLERLPPSTYRRPMLATGFCGALTTFATLQYELFDLLRLHRYLLAAAYAAATVLGGFALLLTAVWLVRRTRLA